MAEYRIVIRVDGEGNAQAFLGGVGGALGNIAQIAAGGLIAGGIMRIGDAIGSTIGNALQATASYENLGISLEGLLAREIKNASGIEKTINVGQQRIQLTQKEIAELGKLKQSLNDETLKRETLAATIQEQKERIRQLTMQYGENGLVVLKEKAQLAEMENAYAKSGAAIDAYGSKVAALEGKQGALVNVTQKVIEGQLSMDEALAQAGPKAQELLQWIQTLAIQSPFKQAQISDAFKTAMAYGFTSDEAKKLTGQLVDFSAVVDPTGQKMGLIAYALGQIRNSDKLLTQDLRQLMNAGVDVNGILKTMGFSLSDVGKKSISSQKFLEAFSAMMDKDFAGAAKRSAGTLTGLLSSLDDIKEVGLRNLFEGAFGALKPLLQDAVNTFSDPAFMDKLRGVGTAIGQGVSTAVSWVKQGIFWVMQFWNVFQAGLALGLTPLQALQNALRVMLPPEMQPQLQMFFGLLQQGGAWIGGTLIPMLLQFAAIAGPQLGAGIQLLAVWLQQIFVWGQMLATQALPLLAQGFLWASQNMQIVAPILGVIAAGLGLIFAPLVAIPALLILLATAWANNWGGIQEKTAAVWAVIQPILAGIGGFITGTIIPGAMQMAAWLGTNVPLAFLNLQAGIQTLDPFWAILKKGIDATIGILTSLGDIWNNVNRLVNELSRYLGNVIAQFLGINTSAQATQQRMDGLRDTLGVIGGVINWFIEQILRELNREFSALVGWLEEAARWLGLISDALANLHLPDQFQRHSPSPFEQMLMNSNAHLREMSGLLPRSLGALNGYGFAGMTPALAGGYSGGATSYDQRRVIHISGPVRVQANNVREFWESLQATVDEEESFVG